MPYRRDAVSRKRRSPLIAALVGATMLMLGLPALPAAGQSADASIAFLNPSPFSTGDLPVVSDKKAGDDSTYRISAWTSNAPSGPIVEFELQTQAGTHVQTIDGARQTGPNDYSSQWDISSDVESGQYKLVARLHPGPTSEAIATDSQEILLLTGATAADTADLTYPDEAGDLGTFTVPSGGSTASGRSNAVVDIAASAENKVSVFYTTSAPGSAPEWRFCGKETSAQAAGGLRCTLREDDPATLTIDENDDPLDISAVGVVEFDSTGENKQAGDAVSVTPYAQQPTNLDITVENAQKNADANGAFPCSDAVTLNVLDQENRPIAAANIDVHATGPSDQLSFDTGYSSVTGRSNEKPDAGHSGDEEGFKCTVSDDNVGRQGDHSIVGGSDLKHIESTAGTNDRGNFSFKLHTDRAGVTEITTWADESDDDVFSSDESACTTSLGWGQDAPAEGQCIFVEPDPDPDPDPDPEPSGERSITLSANDSRVNKGDRVRFSGAITADEATCEAAQTVKLKARPADGRYRTIATKVTSDSGSYGFRTTVKRTKEYRVVAPPAGICEKAKSSTVKVRVRR